MNKLPAKQIYLLTIIIFGIIAVSIYSTYSIFTLEQSSKDIVSIHTPSDLTISLDSYEYRQISVPANSSITTDVDIYNNFNYDICYSIWYKLVTKNADNSKIKIYQNTDNSITTSSTLTAVSNRRITLLITNDYDFDIKINIGVSSAENKDTCELNISEDKLSITNTINNPSLLSSSIIDNTEETEIEAGYLTYIEKTENITLPNSIYIAKEFTYKDELFKLTEPIENTLEKLSDYENYYTCLNNQTCDKLYKITTIEKEDNTYTMTKYDLLTGYLSGKNGLRKINNDYYFYGDNPNNYIYYNCINELDNKTCELWRIIGFKYDDKTSKYVTKIIKDDYLAKFKYDDKTQLWPEASINKYFDSEYKINDNYLTNIPVNQENIIDLNIKKDDIKFYNNLNKPTDDKFNITLLTLSDYLNTSICENREINKYDETCLKNNWLNKNSQINEWTTSIKYEEPYEDELTKDLITPVNNTIYSVGNTIEDNRIDTELYIRPVVYLKERMLLINGNGSFDNPYIIK